MVYPTIYKGLHIPGGAGFLPSTVSLSSAGETNPPKLDPPRCCPSENQEPQSDFARKTGRRILATSSIIMHNYGEIVGQEMANNTVYTVSNNPHTHTNWWIAANLCAHSVRLRSFSSVPQLCSCHAADIPTRRRAANDGSQFLAM